MSGRNRTAQSVRLVAVCVILLTSGCLGLFGPHQPPSDQRALNAVERSRDALDDVRSYRTTIDGRVTATTEDDDYSVDVVGDVSVNVSTRRLNATSRVRGLSTGNTIRRAFVTGETAYIECSRMGWERRNLSQPVRWISYTPAGQQLALLNRSNVYWRGTERVAGTETAVVVAHPTAQEFESVPSVRETTTTARFGGTTIDNATVTVWLDTATWRPVKTRRQVTVSQGGTQATTTATFRFVDYDEPTRVARPSFDEDAVWTVGCPGNS